MNTLKVITPRQLTNLRKAIDAGLKVLRKPEPQTCAEWADANFYLSPESSYTQGRWETAPFQVAILNAMGNDDIREVNLVKSARVGYTKMILAAIGYFVEHKQRNQLLWQPTDQAAEEFMKQHVDPMVRDVRSVRSLAPWLEKKHKDNTINYKRFSNSRQLMIKGGKSAKNYREKSVGVVYYDELSSFDPDIEKEGSPVVLGDKRVEGAAFPKSIRGSTPKLADSCQISLAAEDAEAHFHRFVPCPKCSHMQRLEWGGPDSDFGIKWDRDGDTHRTETAYYVCAGCSKKIDNRMLDKMDSNGEWRSDTGLMTLDGMRFYRRGKRGAEVLTETPETAAFYIWAAYSPWTTWAKIAKDFVAASRDPIKLKTWVNTTRGEPWEEQGSKLEGHSLYMRREHYPASVPQKAVVLVAGVDTQDDRLEASIWAFGGEYGDESWLVSHDIFWGDPGRSELWDRLDDYLMKPWEHESGTTLRVAATAVDTGGHYTDSVYKFCKNRKNRRIYAIKGSNQRAMPLVSRPSKNNKAKINLFSVGTDTAKELIFGRLHIPDPGPGYVHFPVGVAGVDEEYFEQLTSEKRVTKYIKGRPVKVFEPIRKRNEALDTFVYALVALEILNHNFKKLAERLAEEPDPDDEPPPTEPERPSKSAAKKSTRRARRRPGHKGGYVQSWRN